MIVKQPVFVVICLRFVICHPYLKSVKENVRMSNPEILVKLRIFEDLRRHKNPSMVLDSQWLM